MTRLVHYHPPEAEQLDHLAREVCRGLDLDPRTKRGVAYELAGFMRVIARACANDLNRQQGGQLDNDHETA